MEGVNRALVRRTYSANTDLTRVSQTPTHAEAVQFPFQGCGGKLRILKYAPSPHTFWDPAEWRQFVKSIDLAKIKIPLHE